jgi:hypothetical protein
VHGLDRDVWRGAYHDWRFIIPNAASERLQYEKELFGKHGNDLVAGRQNCLNFKHSNQTKQSNRLSLSAILQSLPSSPQRLRQVIANAGYLAET